MFTADILPDWDAVCVENAGILMYWSLMTVAFGCANVVRDTQSTSCTAIG